MKLLFPFFVKAAKRKKRIDEGWEYARLPQFSYHTTEHTLDLARRRRWHRKLVNVDPTKRPIFYFADEKKKKKVFLMLFFKYPILCICLLTEER